ncbi:MAG: hypothetical protein DDT25_01246 [Chloroflexi bacterium]|nr:hypothetical protein [Chloroflexota bacterium]
MEKWGKIVEGERGKFVIDLRDPTQTRYEMVRELTLSSKPKLSPDRIERTSHNDLERKGLTKECRG